MCRWTVGNNDRVSGEDACEFIINLISVLHRMANRLLAGEFSECSEERATAKRIAALVLFEQGSGVGYR